MGAQSKSTRQKSEEPRLGRIRLRWVIFSDTRKKTAFPPSLLIHNRHLNKAHKHAFNRNISLTQRPEHMIIMPADDGHVHPSRTTSIGFKSSQPASRSRKFCKSFAGLLHHVCLLHPTIRCVRSTFSPCFRRIGLLCVRRSVLRHLVRQTRRPARRCQAIRLRRSNRTPAPSSFAGGRCRPDSGGDGMKRRKSRRGKRGEGGRRRSCGRGFGGLLRLLWWWRGGLSARSVRGGRRRRHHRRGGGRMHVNVGGACAVGAVKCVACSALSAPLNGERELRFLLDVGDLLLWTAAARGERWRRPPLPSTAPRASAGDRARR